MTQPDLPPPIDTSHEPPFWQMDWQKWERLTIAIFEREPGIATANAYGQSGQSQFGIDVIGRLEGEGLEVASCKLTQTIAASNLAKWSDDFLKHWDKRWKDKGVRRFVLATTAINVADRKIQDRIETERARFRTLDVNYELWGPTQLTAKLRPQRAIVAAYLGPWVDIICGPIANAAPEQTGATNLAAQDELTQLGHLQAALSGQVAARADRALHDLRAGRYESVRALIDELRGPSAWSDLEKSVQAKIVRLEASLALRTHDFEAARALAAEVRQLEPESERRLEAQIALEKTGVDAAIAELGDPVTPQGRQLLVAFLLMKGEPAQAGGLLDQLQAEGADAETERLTALQRLALGDRAGALEAVRRAEAVAGDWTAVIQAGIITRYAHSLSPLVGSEWLFYPNPVERALVREDDEAQAHLEEALQLVERMSQTSDAADVDLWKLAILGNRRNQQEAASDLARVILERTPADLTVIGWSINRGLDVEFNPSLEALKAEYVRGASEVIVRFLGLLLINLEREQAADFLSDHLDAQASDARLEAERWIARLEERPEPGPAKPDDAYPIVLRLGRERGNWAEVARIAGERLSRNPPDIEGLGLAEAMAEHNRWDLLYPLCGRLLAFETPGAVRIAAYAFYNTSRFKEVLDLLEQHRSLFGPDLPESLRQLKAQALLRSGRPQQSLAEIESLSGPVSGKAKLLAAEIRARIGDPRSGIPVVREALRTGELSGIHALQWSQILEAEDPELARELWRTALPEASKGAAAVAMMHHAFRLGLDAESAALMGEVRAYAMAGGPGIFLADIADMKGMMAEWREAAENVERLYRNSELPLHLAVRSDEAQFLRTLAFEDPSDPRLSPRLIRSGARPTELRLGLKWEDVVLHLDVSGLIIADRLGLLDIIEGTAAPVRVSSNLPDILQSMEHGTRPHQPSQRNAREAALKALSDGLVTVAAGDSRPPSEIELSFGINEPAPIGALVRGLEARGVLTAAQAADALGQVSNSDTTILDLSSVETIHLDFLALTDIAGAGLLTLLAERFSIRTTPQARDQLRLEMEHAAEQDRLAAIARRLRERVAGHIVTGRFQLLDPTHPPEKMLADGQENVPMLARSLAELLSAPAAENGIVWIDDRMVSSYSQTATLPVIGIFEVLQTLAFEGWLSRSDYLDKVRSLRALGACFIPFEHDEVTGPILNAPIVDGIVVETPELQALRRSFALAGQLEGNLQIALPGTANPHGRPDEFEYPKTAMRLLGACLGSVWDQEPLDDERANAQSDWLWFALREIQLNRPIPGDDPKAAQDFFEAVQIGHLVDKAIDVGGLSDERRSARESYLNWLWHRCIRPKAAADATYLERIGDHLADFYRMLLHDRDGAKGLRDQRILASLVWRRLQRIPAPVRDRVTATGRFPEFVRVNQSLSMGRLRFEPGAFWRAVRRARRYGQSRLRTLRGRKVRMTCDEFAIRISGPARLRLADKLNDIVAARPPELPALVDDYLDFVDLERANRAEVRAKALLLHRDAGALASLLAKLRESSPVRGYDVLFDKLRDARLIDPEHFHPAAVDRMIEFGGLSAGGELDIGAAWDRLSGRVGAVTAFQRLGFLPVALPERAFGSFDDAELDRLIRSSPSPIPLAHLTAEARRRGWPDERLSGLVDRLVTVVDDTGELQVQLLIWTERAFAKDPRFATCSISIRLALVWLHGGMLLWQIVRARSHAAPAIEYFKDSPPSLSAAEMLTVMEIGDDAASPAKMSAPALLYHALGAMFGTADLSTIVSPETLDELVTRLRLIIGEAVAPMTILLQRREGMPDAMGSWLAAKPVGILDDQMDPDAIRNALIDACLDSFGEPEQDGSGWFNLGATVTMGLSPEQRGRLHNLLQSTDLYDVAIHDGELQPLIWRNLLAAILPDEHEWVTGSLFLLARQCRDRLGRDTDRAERALNQLVDVAILAAANGVGDRTERLSEILVGLGVTWPQSAKALRRIVDNLLSTTSAGEAQALWRAHHQLNSMP